MLTRTTTQLLDSLRDPANADLWQVFDGRYRPVLLAFARRQGLEDEEAAEVAQATLAQFSADYREGRYDRERGRLSAWIMGIARHRVLDAFRARQRRRGQQGETAIGQMPDEDASELAWEQSRRKVILERAMDELRRDSRMDARTILAFDLCAIRSVPAAAAAVQCGMSVAEVYVAKNRAIKKLREIVATMTMEFDEA